MRAEDDIATEPERAASELDRMAELVAEAEHARDRGSRFVALAAHELRAPATVIHGIATTLLARGGRLDEEQVASLHELLHEQTGRLCKLTDQLLDLSRLDADSVRIEREQFLIRRRVEELVSAVAAERREDVRIVVDPELQAVVDPHAFDRIVGNLVRNALAYGAAPVRIEAEQADRHFRLTVEDGGEGVAPSFAGRLFERFARAPDAAAGGTGLGLAIAQQYAVAHGGRIVYEPADPHGARFRVVLPAPHPEH